MVVSWHLWFFIVFLFSDHIFNIDSLMLFVFHSAKKSALVADGELHPYCPIRPLIISTYCVFEMPVYRMAWIHLYRLLYRHDMVASCVGWTRKKTVFDLSCDLISGTRYIADVCPTSHTGP